MASLCPICAKQVRPRTSNKAFPFCTARCKSVDLGKWLDEAYRIPVEEPVDVEALASNADGSPRPD